MLVTNSADEDRLAGRHSAAASGVDGPKASHILAAVALALGLCPADPCLADAGGFPHAGLDGSPGGTIWIIPEAELLVLDEEHPLPPEGGVPVLPALEGILRFTAHSPLPEWAVAVELEPLAGSGSDLDLSQVSVSSPETGGEFVPVGGRPIVARGTGPQPVEDLWVRLRVRPAWTDVPGPCQGILRLYPVLPTEQEAEGVDWGAVAVPVEMTIDGFTAVVTSNVEFRIDGGPGPGRYVLDPDLGVVVASNEAEWKLRVEGTPFVSEESEIPLERAEWSELEPGGEPGIWTALGESRVLMWGCGERGVFSASFRLALDVTAADRAGDYVCRLMLVGSPP